jgi:concanavalin A-like lectin/glucanase superfamily protein/Big-like domain-containing protein
VSAASAEKKVTMDATPPTVSITAPVTGSTVSNTVSVDATAADAVGVAGVQLRLDGNALGAEDTTAPYSVSWNTTTATNVGHNLTAVARDAAGNTTTSAVVGVTVSNTVPPPTGLVSALGFDEATGTTATDSSGASNPGTINGPTRSTTGKFGGALSFDGVNDIVTVADSNSLDLTAGMTLEAWVRPSVITGWRTVLMKERTGGLVYALYSNGDTNRPNAHAFIGSTEFDTRGTAQVAANVWTHLAATYDGLNLRLYVNGTQTASRALTGNMVTSTGALRIGGNNIWPEWFAGLIDEVRVYNKALTATEVAADMNRPISGG